MKVTHLFDLEIAKTIPSLILEKREKRKHDPQLHLVLVFILTVKLNFKCLINIGHITFLSNSAFE